MSVFTTADVPGADRATRWNAIIAQTYFPLQLDFRDSARFEGRLTHNTYGQVAVSRLTSDPVSYTRRGKHIRADREADYLITMPRRTPVEFCQFGRDVRCGPGGFIIERGDAPYRFRYGQPNDLFVLKVSKADLSTRVARPDSLCARVFDATRGTAQVFAGMVDLAQSSASDLDPRAQDALGRQLLEFLALAVDDTPLDSNEATSAVRAAHLARIDRFIRANIKAADLSPDRIAEACGISKRYLHDLYRSTDQTVAQQVRAYRLLAAREDLNHGRQDSIAAVAYRYGFSDQAQFSRMFKAEFGITPSAYRSGARH